MTVDVPKELRVDNGGVDLAMSVVGDGPDLLFVHGLGSSQPLWGPLVRALADNYRCWNLDLRGHGDSDRAGRAYTRLDYASDTAAALDHIGRPVIAVGHSLGGMTIAHAATLGHPWIRAAYLIDAPLFRPAGGESPMRPVFERQLEMIERYQQQERPVADYEATLSRAPAPGGSTIGEVMVAEHLRARAEGLAKLDPATLHARLDGSLAIDPEPPVFQVPARVLAADPDLGPAFRPEWIPRLAELSPQVEVETLLGVGHQMMMMRGYDEIVLADLVDWLGRLD